MNQVPLYPSSPEQDSIRLVIARNLAFLEAFEAKDATFKPQLDNSYLVLKRLGGSFRLSYDEIRLLKRTLTHLKYMGIPVADSHRLLDEVN